MCVSEVDLGGLLIDETALLQSLSQRSGLRYSLTTSQVYQADLRHLLCTSLEQRGGKHSLSECGAWTYETSKEFGISRG